MRQPLQRLDARRIVLARRAGVAEEGTYLRVPRHQVFLAGATEYEGRVVIVDVLRPQAMHGVRREIAVWQAPCTLLICRRDLLLAPVAEERDHGVEEEKVQEDVRHERHAAFQHELLTLLTVAEDAVRGVETLEPLDAIRLVERAAEEQAARNSQKRLSPHVGAHTRERARGYGTENAVLVVAVDVRERDRARPKHCRGQTAREPEDERTKRSTERHIRVP